MRPRQIILVVIGVLTSVGLLWLAACFLEWDKVVAALQQTDVFPWVPLAMISYLVGHVIRGVRCRLLVSREATLALPTATNVVVVGYAVNNILPLRLGEFARAGMLAERSGLPFVQSLTVTFLERILDGLVILFLLLVTVIAIPSETLVRSAVVFEETEVRLEDIIRFASAVFFLAALGVFAAAACPGYLLSLASRVTSRLMPRLHDPLVRFCSLVINGVSYLRRPTDVLIIVALSVIVWLFEAGMFVFVLPAFGLSMDPWVAILCMTVTNLCILVPSSPGFVGTFHISCMIALVMVGVSREVGFGYAVIVHLVFFVPITAWGVGALASYGMTLGRTFVWSKEAQRLRLISAQPGIGKGLSHAIVSVRSEEPTHFMMALTEAVIASAPVPTADFDRRAAVRPVAAFVHGQICALPTRLRVMFTVAMWCVRLITRLRFMQGFCALPLEKRRRWVENWAYGRFALGRQLFRGVRSTAILAFYEIPSAQAPVGQEHVDLNTQKEQPAASED